MEITGDILRALRCAIDAHKNNANFAAAVGVTPSQVGRYLSGATKWCQPKVWAKLEPKLRPYLPPAGAPGLRDGDGVAYGAAEPVPAEDRQVLDMLRALPPSERARFVEQLKDGFIRVTLASAKTG